MDFFHLLLLGLLQGLTEFLPISSSAHLILLPELMDYPDQGRRYDVAAHAGSLLAVSWYFRQRLGQIITGWLGSFTQPPSQDGRLAWYLLIATVPVCLAGMVIAVLLELDLRHPLIIAAATLLFALPLWWADVTGRRERVLTDVTLRDALIIGCVQMLALIPGASRSGVTITAGLLLGLDRQATSHFSFLLAIPVILIASAYEVLELIDSTAPVDWKGLLTVVLVSFLSAYVAIHYFLKLLDRIALLPYVIYRLLLGGLLFVIFI